MPEAINHALEGLDHARACRLIEALVEECVRAQSGLSMVWGWIRRLPSAGRDDAPVAVHHAGHVGHVPQSGRQNGTLLEGGRKGHAPGGPP